jgi:hypothetical protein
MQVFGRCQGGRWAADETQTLRRKKPRPCARRSDIHEEAFVKTGARRLRDFPDIHSASAAAAARHERACACPHSHQRRRSAPCRTPGCNPSPALGLDGEPFGPLFACPTQPGERLEPQRIETLEPALVETPFFPSHRGRAVPAAARGGRRGASPVAPLLGRMTGSRLRRGRRGAGKKPGSGRVPSRVSNACDNAIARAWQHPAVPRQRAAVTGRVA